MPDKTHLNSVMETKLAKQKIIRKITSSGDPLSGASRPSSNSVCPNTRWSWRVLPWDATGALYRELFDQHMSSELPWVLGTCRDTHLRSRSLNERLCWPNSGNNTSNWLGCPSRLSETKDNRGDLWLASPPIKPVYRQASDPMRTWIMCWDSVKVQWEHCVRDSFYSRPEQSQTTCPIAQMFE